MSPTPGCHTRGLAQVWAAAAALKKALAANANWKRHFMVFSKKWA
jgi:hypothetical protein